MFFSFAALPLAFCADKTGAAGSEWASKPIAHGIELDETNTGLPPGHALTDVGKSITVTEAWIKAANGGSRVLENRNFLSGSRLTIDADDFTVRFCKFNGKGGIYVKEGRKRISIYDTELDGNHENLKSSIAITNGGIRLTRVRVHRWPRALWIGKGDVLVEECYFHDLTSDDSGAHIENVYIAGGADQTYVRNKFIANRVSVNGGNGAISASLAIYNESWAPFPPLDRITVRDNYLETSGGYTMYGGALKNKKAPWAVNMVVEGNIFGRTLNRKSGKFGPVTAFDESGSGNKWANNRWGARGPFWVEGDPEEGAEIRPPAPR